MAIGITRWSLDFGVVSSPRVIARRLVAKCDACLRIGGPSAGADEMVALAKENGKLVFHRFEDIPGCAR